MGDLATRFVVAPHTAVSGFFSVGGSLFELDESVRGARLDGSLDTVSTICGRIASGEHSFHAYEAAVARGAAYLCAMGGGDEAILNAYLDSPTEALSTVVSQRHSHIINLPAVFGHYGMRSADPAVQIKIRVALLERHGMLHRDAWVLQQYKIPQIYLESAALWPFAFFSGFGDKVLSGDSMEAQRWYTQSEWSGLSDEQEQSSSGEVEGDADARAEGTVVDAAKTRKPPPGVFLAATPGSSSPADTGRHDPHAFDAVLTKDKALWPLHGDQVEGKNLGFSMQAYVEFGHPDPYDHLIFGDHGSNWRTALNIGFITTMASHPFNPKNDVGFKDWVSGIEQELEVHFCQEDSSGAVDNCKKLRIIRDLGVKNWYPVVGAMVYGGMAAACCCACKQVRKQCKKCRRPGGADGGAGDVIQSQRGCCSRCCRDAVSRCCSSMERGGVCDRPGVLYQGLLSTSHQNQQPLSHTSDEELD